MSLTTAKKEATPVRLTDEVLFKRFQEGSEESFNELLDRYKGPLFGLILKSVGNQAEAEEVFQDVFFKVIEKRDSFQNHTSFKAWIYTVTRNTCIDRARKLGRRPQVHSIFRDEEKPLEINIDSGDKTPEVINLNAQIDDFLEEALKELPSEQKETFLYKVKGEMTFEEISEVMNCSVNTAKSRMRYATATLKSVFEKRGYLK